MADDRPLEEQLRADTNEGILRLTLDRPDAGNALTPDQRDRMIELLHEASSDVAVRVVVLAANGRHFCTGADLRASRPPAPKPEDAPEKIVGDVSRMLREGSQRLISAVLDCEKPVIAAVNGAAAGIGAHLALACDLVIAADGARFIEVFVRRGLVPDGGGAYLLPRLVGVAKAKELLLLGDDLSAADAERIGLVSRVVPAEQLDAQVHALAERMAAMPTRALGLTKWLVNRSLESDRATAFREEALAQELNMTTEDANEGVQAFVERRDPAYKGW